MPAHEFSAVSRPVNPLAAFGKAVSGLYGPLLDTTLRTGLVHISETAVIFDLYHVYHHGRRTDISVVPDNDTGGFNLRVREPQKEEVVIPCADIDQVATGVRAVISTHLDIYAADRAVKEEVFPRLLPA